MTTISVCIVARNDYHFLRQCIKAADEYADEIVVIDNGSTDESWDWLSTVVQVRKGLKIHQAPSGVLLEKGYSHLKNVAIEMATCEWVHSLDADECLSPEQREQVKPYLERCHHPVVSIRTLTFLPNPDFQGETYWPRLMMNMKHEEMRHRRIHRRADDIRWKGFIHEELYVGKVNGAARCANSDLKHLHFTNFRTWGSNDHKRAQYAWMLLKAYRDPALQDGTNRWWYATHVPDNMKDLEHWALRFETEFA